MYDYSEFSCLLTSNQQYDDTALDDFSSRRIDEYGIQIASIPWISSMQLADIDFFPK